jgi:hypothetical protein
MTIQNAQAQLTVTVDCLAKTGFIPYADGVIDAQTGTVKALGSSSWNSLAGTTWG